MFAANSLRRLASAGRQQQYVIRQAFLSTATKPSSLIINAVGRDRLGIVSEITGMVIDCGGNVGDSQAAKLGQHFSLMMLVSVPSGEKCDQLKMKLSQMPDMNATVFESDSDDASKLTPQVGYSGYFTLEGADNPGIVHKITTALAKNGLSIDKMETDQEIAPYGGAMLFKMRGLANAAAPLAAGFDIAKIKLELEELGESLNCEVEMHDAVDEKYQGSFYAG